MHLQRHFLLFLRLLLLVYWLEDYSLLPIADLALIAEQFLFLMSWFFSSWLGLALIQYIYRIAPYPIEHSVDVCWSFVWYFLNHNKLLPDKYWTLRLTNVANGNYWCKCRFR